MNRTRAQRRLRKQGYTHEQTHLGPSWIPGWTTGPKLIYLRNATMGRKALRETTLAGDVLRPVGKHYIHNGKTPR